MEEKEIKIKTYYMKLLIKLVWAAFKGNMAIKEIDQWLKRFLRWTLKTFLIR